MTDKEKIKEEVLKELVKEPIEGQTKNYQRLYYKNRCSGAIDLAISKTSKAIFDDLKDISKGITINWVLEIPYKDFKELKKKWCDE